ncbi:hypothetical protein LCGC14_3117670, partial [marine sediment metagenome]
QSEEILVLDAVGTAVNHLRITNSITTGGPNISAIGDDTDIDLQLQGKGTGTVRFGSDLQFNAATRNIIDSSGNEMITFIRTIDAVNELTIRNAAAGSEPIISATGGDTDVGITLTPKGSGEVNITANDLNLSGTTPNIQVGGADPDRIISLPAASWSPTTTAPCADITTVEAGTNDIDYKVLDFDTSTDENAFINFQMPTSWDGGVIQFRYVWTNASGTSAQTVTWELSGTSYADNDAIDGAVGTAIELADTFLAQGDVHISAFSGDVTLAGSPAGGQWIHLEIMRDVTSDNLTGDARLIEVQIKYKTGQYSE